MDDCNLRRMMLKDIPKVVQLHLSSFPEFFLSFLGHRFLLEFYKSFVFDPMGIAFVAHNSDNQITGVVVGPLNPEGYFLRLVKRRWWAFGLASMGAVIRRPSSIKRLFRALFYRGGGPSGPARALLSSIAVSPEAQDMGVGKKLVLRWLAEIKNHGGSGCYLITDARGNNDVNLFYQSLGWTIESSFRSPEGRLMNRYIFDF